MYYIPLSGQTIIWRCFLVGIKNMFKKSSKIFDKEGFYIILFVCLCIVAVTAVYMSRNSARLAKKNMEQQKQLQQSEPVDNGPELAEKEANNNSTPVMQQPVKSTPSSKNSINAVAKTNSSVKKTSSVSVSAVKLAMPVNGEVYKKFDKDKLVLSQTMQQYETHEGIDIRCELGTEVKASADGKVVTVDKNDEQLIPGTGNKTGYGARVEIDHGNGIITAYCNLADDIKVKVGDKIKKGQVIGTAGDTSVREAVAIEGSHLHFVVLKKTGKDYNPVDPLAYLK